MTDFNAIHIVPPFCNTYLLDTDTLTLTELKRPLGQVYDLYPNRYLGYVLKIFAVQFIVVRRWYSFTFLLIILLLIVGFTVC